jgi:quercetin dioxygenase-like cupin family protein
VLAVVHVVKGADGRSHFAPDAIAAETKDYLKTGKPFRQIDFGAATKVQLVSGPPGVTFPFHASLGHEMFLTLAGESFVTLSDGKEQAILPGTLVVMDDMGSASGHGGRTGPCGYVALQIVPAAAASTSVPHTKEH